MFKGSEFIGKVSGYYTNDQKKEFIKNIKKVMRKNTLSRILKK